MSFSGERFHLEQDVIAESLANAGAYAMEDGKFLGMIGSRKVELNLRSDTFNGRRIWIANMIMFGSYFPMQGRADSNGVLRLVHTPNANPASPNDISGITASFVKMTPKGVDLRGFFYVPRNGTIEELRLTKGSRVGLPHSHGE